jgi:hypothetical protein
MTKKPPSDAKLREALVEALILATNAKALTLERAGQVLDRWDELAQDGHGAATGVL